MTQLPFKDKRLTLFAKAVALKMIDIRLGADDKIEERACLWQSP